MNGVGRGAAGHEDWIGLGTLPRHRHDSAYAAVILCGGYEECGSYGRYRAKAGHVLLHRSFDAHLDRFERRGARVLNLPLDEPPVSGWAGSATPTPSRGSLPPISSPPAWL